MTLIKIFYDKMDLLLLLVNKLLLISAPKQEKPDMLWSSLLLGLTYGN